MNKPALITLLFFLLIFFSCNKEEDLNDDNSSTPANSGTFKDYRDGKTYEWIRIGRQVWMTENLAYKANHGCWAYDNDESNVNDYGYLYNWEAAVNVCPVGWHLPSDDEWKTLERYLGMSKGEADNEGWRGTDEGKKLKSTNGWELSGNGTNEVGFSALPGGYEIDGCFSDLSYCGYWWSATEHSPIDASYRCLIYSHDEVYRDFIDKDYGFSIRCVRND